MHACIICLTKIDKMGSISCFILKHCIPNTAADLFGCLLGHMGRINIEFNSKINFIDCRHKLFS